MNQAEGSPIGSQLQRPQRKRVSEQAHVRQGLGKGGYSLCNKILIETEEQLHVLFVQLKVEDVGVLDNALLRDRFWDLS